MKGPSRAKPGQSKDMSALQDRIRELELSVAKQKKENEELQASELRHRRLLEVTCDLIYITDKKGCLTYLNPALDRELGYPDRELQGKPFTAIFAPERGAEDRAVFQKALQGENIPVYITDMVRRDGTRLPVEINVTTIYDEDGSFAGRYCVGRNITRHVQAEEAQRASELKYRQIIENSRDLIYLADARGRLTYLNPTLEKTLGYTAAEWNGKPFTTFLAPEYVAAAKAIFTRAMDGEIVPVYETEMLRKDGTRLSVEINVTTLLDKEGRPTGRHGIGRDITERKQAEEARRQSELQYRQLIEITRDLIYVADSQGRLTYINPTLDRTLGYAREEWYGQSFTLLFAPEYVATAQEIFARATAGETIPVYATEMIRKDGTRIPVEVNITSLYDTDGKFAGRYCVGRDITRRRKAEEAQRESELKYRQLIETSQDLIYIIDKSGCLTYINPTLDKTLGYDREEWCGQPFTRVVAPGFAATAEDIFRRAMGGEIITACETQMIRKDGTILFVEVNVTTLYDKDGQPAGRYGIGRDITERKRAEQAQRESELKYRQLIESSRDLIYVADGQGRLTYLNPALDRALGYAHEEWYGKSYTLLFAPEYVAAAQDIFARAVAGETIPVYATEMIRKNWTRIPVEVNIISLYDTEGKFAGRYCIGRDITLRREAEEARRESELKYRRLIETSRDLIYIIDKNANLTYINPTLEKTLGYRFEEWNGQRFTLMLAPEYIKEAESVFDRAMQGESITAYTAEMIKKDGTRFFAEVNITTLRDKDGNFAGRYGIGRDVTERKRAEEALRESEDKYRRLTEDIPAFVATFLPDGTLNYVNKALTEWVGLTAAELTGQSIYDLMSDDNGADVKKNLALLTPEQPVGTFEQLYRRRGRQIFNQWVVRGFFNLRKQAVRYQAIGLDITKRKQAEEELRELGNKYITIFENTGTATIILEEDKTISLVNTEFENLTGYTRQEIEGRKRWSEFVVEEDRERMARLHTLRRIDGGAAQKNYEFRFVDKGGAVKDLHLNIDIIPGTKKSVASFLNITERKRIEAEREHLIEELQNAIEQIKTLKGIVPICANCKKIRDDKGYWEQVDEYVGKHTEAQFSHGICPECMKKLYPEYCQQHQPEHLE